MPAGEGLAQRGGLDNSFVGELLVGWGHDAQSRWRLIPSRHTGSLCRKLAHGVPISAVIRTISLRRLLLQPSLDNASLLFPDVQALLQVFLHDGVLCNEAWGQAGQSNLLDAEAVSSSQSRACSGRA
jgi:hypothetical protein